MKSIDWGLVRIQYEIFGEEVSVLAEEYDTTPRMINYAAEEGGWQRMPIAKALADWKQIDNLEEIPSDLLDNVKDRMQILFTLKQSALNPRYIAIETALLGKAQQVIQNLGPDHPNAAAVLKSMADMFVSLRAANGVGGSQAADEDDKGVRVQIMQRIERAGVNGSPAQIENTGVQVAINKGVAQTTPNN